MAILAATDFSKPSREAIRRAAEFADRRRTGLVVVHSLVEAIEGPPWGHLLDNPPDLEKRMRRAASERLETFVDESLSAERPESVEYRIELDRPAEGILAAAEELAPEMLVVGACGHGRVAEMLLGSTAEKVVRGAIRPVFVVPEETGLEPIDRIVAPVDLSTCSRRSLELAVQMAREHEAELTVLYAHAPPMAEPHVVSSVLTPEHYGEIEEQQRHRYAEFLDGIDFDGVDSDDQFRVGLPHEAILDTIDDTDADLVVLGTHGRRGLERMFLGSTTSKILRQMPCGVMTIRGPERDDE